MGNRHPVAILLAASLAADASSAAQKPPPPAAGNAAAAAYGQPALILPAFTGYAHPDPDDLRRNRNRGAVVHCGGSLVFYVRLAATGDLEVRLRHGDGIAGQLVTAVAARPAAANDPFAATATTQPLPATSTVTPMPGSQTTVLGTFAIQVPGYHRIDIRSGDGGPLTDLEALELHGPPAVGAHANVLERRNAASVHLGYPLPDAARDRVEWFYVEITPRTDPLWSYYMATGWHRGYFGMQVNSPTERRLIFSVWDAGDEPTDRSRVPAANRVQLIAKGEGVVASEFGNEGTGGHSHLVHHWRLGETHRFLLHAARADDATIYTGWFWFAKPGKWGLIASFRAPRDASGPRGLHSFSENFAGQNGDAPRDCEFRNVWVRPRGGDWLPLRSARFTHDETGRAARLDRWAGVRGAGFYLRHGDFADPPGEAITAAGDRLQLPRGDHGFPPADAELPVPPNATR